MVERGDNIKRIAFSQLPDGLLTRPTLVWEVEAKKAGKHLVEVSYIANGIRWRSDYNVVLNEGDTQADISGWVTVENNTGTAFDKARVKLLAGDPKPDYEHMAYGYGPGYYKLVETQPPTDRIGNDPSRAFGDYRMYTLPEPTTVGNNQIKQVELIKATGVPVTKTYLYDGAKLTWYRYGYYIDPGYGREANKKVNVHRGDGEPRRQATWASPCPRASAGRTRRTPTGRWSSSARTPSTTPPATSGWRCTSATPSTWSASASRPSSQKINDHECTESFEIKVRNHKKEAVTVKVLEKMYRSADWDITAKSHDFQKLDVRTVVFPVKVEADKETTVTYTVHYRW